MIFAIDPGPKQSGWVLYDAADGIVLDAGVHDNHDLLRWVQAGQGAKTLAIETMQANYAATVGASVIDTLRWVGRFQQAWAAPEEVVLLTRQAVKQAVCGNVKAKDSGVRQAMIDRLGPVGTKASPGPCYGVTSHAWQALAVAVCAAGVDLRPEPSKPKTVSINAADVPY